MLFQNHFQTIVWYASDLMPFQAYLSSKGKKKENHLNSKGFG